MTLTYEEFCKDPMKYIKIAETEEILLVNNGMVYVHLFNPHAEKLKAARSLFGILKGYDIEDIDR